MKRASLAIVLGIAQGMNWPGATAEAAQPRGPTVIYLQSEEEPASHFRDMMAAFEREVLPVHPTASLEVRRTPTGSERVIGAFLESLDNPRPAAVVTAHTLIAQVAAKRIPAIPVLLLTLADPVMLGLVDNPISPSANVTGYSFEVPYEMKHLEILRECVPSIRRVGVITDAFWATGPVPRRMLAEGPSLLGVSVEIVVGENPAQFEQITKVASRVDGWFVPDTPLNRIHAERIAELIRRTGKPSIGGVTSHLQYGGLLVYEPLRVDPWPRLGQIARVLLSGVPVRNIPFDRPKLFKLRVSRPAARALGIEIPRSILMRADEIVP